MGSITGKSDFSDIVLMHYSPKEVLNGSVRIHRSKIELNSERDLIPYYPYLISTLASEKTDSGVKLSIDLMSESYTDIKEREFLSSFIYDVIWLLKSKKIKVEDLTPVILKEAFSGSLFSKETLEKAINIFKRDDVLPSLKMLLTILKKTRGYNDFVRGILTTFIKSYMYGIHTIQGDRERFELLKFASNNGWGDVYKSFETVDSLKTFYKDKQNFLEVLSCSESSPILNDVLLKLL